MKLFSATIEEFEGVPKIRLPLKMKWSKEGQRYLSTKQALAWELKKCYHGKDPMTFEMSLSCAIHLRHRRGIDIDNAVGFLMDSLQYAGIVENDKWIKELRKVNLFQGKVNRVVVELRRL